MNTALRITTLWAAAAVLSLTGCARSLMVRATTPDGQILQEAQLSADGTVVGNGQVQLRRRPGQLITASAGPEWYPQSTTISRATPRTLDLQLQPNELYRSTTEDANQVINRWLTLDVSDRAQDSWWASIVAAMTGQSFEIELLDQSSGFLRTAWKQRSYGPVEVRRRFVGNIISTSPLQWRLRYEVQVRPIGSTNWNAYDRGFQGELDALAEIRARIEGDGLHTGDDTMLASHRSRR